MLRDRRFSAEEFDLQQIPRHLCAIDSEKIKSGVKRHLMDETRDRALPATGLSPE